MGKFPKLAEEARENLNRPITSTETGSIITNLSTQESPASDSITDQFYQTLKELTPILLKLFQNREGEGTLPSSLCEGLNAGPGSGLSRCSPKKEHEWPPAPGRRSASTAAGETQSRPTMRYRFTLIRKAVHIFLKNW